MLGLALAIRNLFRHRVRSIIAFSALIFGVVSLLLSGGFIDWIYWALRESTIQNLIGHIQAVKPGYYQKGVADPFDYLLPENSKELETIRSGYWIPFYHVDIDPSENLNNLSNDLAALKNFCEPKGIKLGAFFYGGEPPQSDTNAEYYNVVMNIIIPKVRNGIGVPPHSQFQSYAAGGTLPSNLTECSFFTHSNLINDGYGKLENKGDWAKYATKTHPTSVVKGTQNINVSVSMRNKGGGTTWWPGDYYLVPTSGADNWGISLVPMSSPCLGPFASNQNNVKQFNFQIDAPNTTGCKKFRWKMMVVTENGDKKFGEATPDTCINVTN